MVALPPGFEEVTACLRGDPSPVATLEVPLEFMQPEVVVEPAVAMTCASHVVQEKALGSPIWRWSPPPWVKWPLGIPAWQLKTPSLP